MRKAFCMTLVLLSVWLFAGTLHAAGESESFTFGVSNPDDVQYVTNPPPLLNKQNVNNFYFYYSTLFNADAKIAPRDMVECEYGVNKNSYAQRTMVPKLADVEAYFKNYSEKNPGANLQFWWKIDKFGYTCPAGNMSVIVAFKAPADGDYGIDAEFFGGAKADQGYVADNADGVSIAIQKGEETLWSYDTGKTVTDAANAMKKQIPAVSLKKDETVYFITDPNSGFENDLAHWCISMTNESGASAVASETPPAASETTAAASETPSAASETPSAASETPSAASETPSAASETPSAASETPAATVKTPAAASPRSETSSVPASNGVADKENNTALIVVLIAAAVLLISGGLAFFFKKAAGKK